MLQSFLHRTPFPVQPLHGESFEWLREHLSCSSQLRTAPVATARSRKGLLVSWALTAGRLSMSWKRT
jgi:hypothetical protein